MKYFITNRSSKSGSVTHDCRAFDSHLYRVTTTQNDKHDACKRTKVVGKHRIKIKNDTLRFNDRFGFMIVSSFDVTINCKSLMDSRKSIRGSPGFSKGRFFAVKGKLLLHGRTWIARQKYPFFPRCGKTVGKMKEKSCRRMCAEKSLYPSFGGLFPDILILRASISRRASLTSVTTPIRVSLSALMEMVIFLRSSGVILSRSPIT